MEGVMGLKSKESVGADLVGKRRRAGAHEMKDVFWQAGELYVLVAVRGVTAMVRVEESCSLRCTLRPTRSPKNQKWGCLSLTVRRARIFEYEVAEKGRDVALCQHCCKEGGGLQACPRPIQKPEGL